MRRFFAKPSSSFAALSDDMSSRKSSCSALRWAVASATDLSRLAIPACKSLISAAKVEMLSSVSAIFGSRSEMVPFSTFILSSVLSNCAAQYSFFLSSSSCSVFKVATIASIILITFSKPIFLPWRAKAMKSSRGRTWPNLAMLCWTAASALAFLSVVVLNCTKEEALALGRVFLNKSNASSSFKILIVSATATSSWLRVFWISSHSAAFVAQSDSRLARNFWSAMSAASVSLKSPFIVAISTPSSPTAVVFDSIVLVRAAISFFFAATRASKVAMAEDSSLVMPAKDADISSSNCFKRPTISALPGTSSEFASPPDRKDRSSCLSDSIMSCFASMAFNTNLAELLCKNKPVAPLEIALTADLMAAMFVLYSVDSFANAAASFSRMAVASAMAVFAASRSDFADLRSSLVCTNFASFSSMSLPSWGTATSALAMLASKSALPPLQ
mmetsp:Transcript_76800/g.132864  ORF Transcript_76800/g.132864 Transcript_76800/m.132864 type:complete len:445 (+) Transcript_76800:503-1837(+)